MENKQTAVEWLWRWINDNQEATIEQGNKAFEQAKAMDKEQKIEAYIAGSLTGCGCYKFMKKEDGEQYINKTYGSNK